MGGGMTSVNQPRLGFKLQIVGSILENSTSDDYTEIRSHLLGGTFSECHHTLSSGLRAHSYFFGHNFHSGSQTASFSDGFFHGFRLLNGSLDARLNMLSNFFHGRGRKPSSVKSRVSTSSKLIESKRLQVYYFGHLRKTGGRGSYRLVHAAQRSSGVGLKVLPRSLGPGAARGTQKTCSAGRRAPSAPVKHAGRKERASFRAGKLQRGGKGRAAALGMTEKNKSGLGRARPLQRRE